MAVITSSRSATMPRLLITGLVLIAGALALCGWALASQDAPGRAVISGSAALMAYLAGLLCLAGSRRGELGLARWKLGPWALAWCAVADGLATMAWDPLPGTVTAEISDTSVLRALWLVAAGMTCWVAGYLTGPGALLRNAAARGMRRLAASRSGDVRGPLTPWLLYAVGTVARVASVATTGRLGYAGSAAVTSATGYDQFLADLGLLAPLAVCSAAFLAYRERRPGARVTLVVLFLAEIAYGALTGNKAAFVTAALAVIIPAAAARARLPKGILIAAVAVFLVIVVPFTLAYRTAIRGGVTLTASQAAAQAPGILRQTADGTQALTAVPASLDYLLQRVQEISAPAIIMQRTPSQIPYTSPAQLVTGPLADLVPRALWPGKPILEPGYLFSQEYYGAPATVLSSAAVTPVGDLWRHGGWIPVIAGMFALGCGVRLLDDSLDARTDPHAIFLVLLLFPLVKAENDWVGLLAGIPATIAVWLLGVMLAFRRCPSEPQIQG
jgi:hypothetical protein